MEPFVDLGKLLIQNLQCMELSSLSLLIISILRFLTTISVIRLGSISFFVLLFQAQAAEVQEMSVYPCVLVYFFHKGKGLRDYHIIKSTFCTGYVDKYFNILHIVINIRPDFLGVFFVFLN